MTNTEYVASGGRRLLREVVQIFSIYAIQSEVLATSCGDAAQISEARLVGAGRRQELGQLLMKVADHPLSDEGMATLVADSRAFADLEAIAASSTNGTPSASARSEKEWHMPGRHHVRGAGAKEQRQYEHIKESAQKSGRYGKRAEEVAARTVMKHHKEAGHRKGK